MATYQTPEEPTVRVQVRVVLEWEQDVTVDPDVYEGANSPAECLEKEGEYLAEPDGDYLIQALSAYAPTTTVTVTPLPSADGGAS